MRDRAQAAWGSRDNSLHPSGPRFLPGHGSRGTPECSPVPGIAQLRLESTRIRGVQNHGTESEGLHADRAHDRGRHHRYPRGDRDSRTSSPCRIARRKAAQGEHAHVPARRPRTTVCRTTASTRTAADSRGAASGRWHELQEPVRSHRWARATRGWTWRRTRLALATGATKAGVTVYADSVEPRSTPWPAGQNGRPDARAHQRPVVAPAIAGTRTAGRRARPSSIARAAVQSRAGAISARRSCGGTLRKLRFRAVAPCAANRFGSSCARSGPISPATRSGHDGFRPCRRQGGTPDANLRGHRSAYVRPSTRQRRRARTWHAIRRASR